MFSRRSALDRTPNALERARAELADAGRAPIDLTEGNPTRVGLPRFEAAFRALSSVDPERYEPEPFGAYRARCAVSRYMGAHVVPVPPERVVLTASTSEAYGFLLKALCDPGDEVLVPSPSYPLLEHLARFEHVELVRYPLRYDGRWHVPKDAFAGRVGPRTRAVISVSPNNPTGSRLKRDELSELAALGLPIVSDEVFGAYGLHADADTARSALEAQGPLVVSLHGLSKLAALPQLKLAWLCAAGPAELVDELLGRLALIADAQLSVATPIQLALPAILDAHATARDALLARVRDNLATVGQLLAGSAVTPLHVEAGWYALLRLPAVQSDEAWAVGLLREAGVLVQPGYLFELEPDPHAVVSLIAPPARLRGGLLALRAYVERVTGLRIA